MCKIVFKVKCIHGYWLKQLMSPNLYTTSLVQKRSPLNFPTPHYHAHAQYSSREYQLYTHINLVTTTSKIHCSKIQRPFSPKDVNQANVGQLGKHKSESAVTPQSFAEIPSDTKQRNPSGTSIPEGGDWARFSCRQLGRAGNPVGSPN